MKELLSKHRPEKMSFVSFVLPYALTQNDN